MRQSGTAQTFGIAPPRKRGLRTFVVFGVCVLFVAISVDHMLGIASEQAHLSRDGAWLQEAAEVRELLDRLAEQAQQQADAHPQHFLQIVPGRIRSELDEPRLVNRIPVAVDDRTSANNELTWGAIPLRIALESLANDDIGPAGVAVPAREYARAFSRVIPRAAAHVTRRAQDLSSQRIWLYALTLLLGVGAAFLARLNTRIRKRQDELALAHGALKENEERYRQMFELNHAVKLLLAPDDGRIVDANEAACSFYGLPLAELKTRSLMDVSAQTRSAAEQMAAFAGASGKTTAWLQQRLADGRVRDVEMHASPISIRGTRLVFAIVLDVTDRARAEQALRDSEERLSVTLGSIADAVIGVDAVGQIQLVNAAATALTGWDEAEAVGRPLDQVYRVRDEATGQPVTDAAEAVLAAGEALTGSFLLLDRQGQEHRVEACCAPILDGDGAASGVVLAVRDVTEQRRLQKETRRAEQLESLALLAGGIAHDFNNFLASMLGNLHIASVDVERGSSVWEALKKAESATRHAQSLARQLLSFSKESGAERRTLHLGDLISETVQFALRGSDAVLELDVDEDLAPAEVDEGQMNQVLHNLAINAHQAMPAGGRLTVRACNATVDDTLGLPLRPGDYVHVSIRDTGMGIPADDLERIFDPYFTTKRTGTGLGLASCYSIVRKHEGALTVESEVGEGTTFHLFLPASTRPAEANAQAAPDAPAGTVAQGERVLWMDDDPSVLDMAERMLRRYGYSVTCASHGDEALALYADARAAGEPFDLVVLDLKVPGGKGADDTIGPLLECDPDACAIVSSAFTNHAVMAEYVRYGFRGVLPKPFTRADLASVFIDVLTPTDTATDAAA